MTMQLACGSCAEADAAVAIAPRRFRSSMPRPLKLVAVRIRAARRMRRFRAKGLESWCGSAEPENHTSYAGERDVRPAEARGSVTSCRAPSSDALIRIEATTPAAFITAAARNACADAKRSTDHSTPNAILDHVRFAS